MRAREHMAEQTKRLSEENARLRQELAEAHSFLDAIMECVPAGFAVVDAPDGTIRRVSRYGLEWMGRTGEEIEGIPYEDRPIKWPFFHQEGVVPACGEKLPVMRAALKGEIAVDEKWVARRPDGACRALLCNAHPVRGWKGDVAGGIVAWRDVTERNQIEEELRRKEECLRTLLDNSPDLILRFDDGLRRIYANPAAETFTCFVWPNPASDAPSDSDRGATDFLQRDFSGAIEEPCSKVLKSGVEEICEFPCVTPQGAKTLHCRFVPEFSTDGSVRSILAVARDITDLKQTQSDLREKAGLLDHASDAVIVRGSDHGILFWNAGAEAVYGWTREEAHGKVSHELLRTEFPMPLEEISGVTLREGRWEGELVHLTRDGSRIVVASRWTLLRYSDGRGPATLEIDTDITGRKSMEKQLEEKTRRLQEVNAALKVLLKHRDEDRKDFEDALLSNIENLIVPYLKKMKTAGLSGVQAGLLEILESHLMELTSEFGRTLALQYRVLTPTEMRVAALVRDGKTSKEIADLLCISEKTASFHRNNIRTKLGLRGGRINLRSHLLSLT